MLRCLSAPAAHRALAHDRDGVLPCSPSASLCRRQTSLLQLRRLSACVNRRDSGPCSGFGFGLRERCAPLAFHPDHSGFLLMSSESASLSSHPCVHWRSTSQFLPELLLCTHSLANRLEQEAQRLACPSFRHAFLTELSHF